MQAIALLSNLTDRRAMLTGGAGYIGLAVAETLIELGATVAIVDKDAEACDKRVAALEKVRPNSAVPIPCDLGHERSTRDAVGKTSRVLGGIDILIHCAAYVGTTKVPGWAVPFEQQSVSAWDRAMRINLTAAFVLVQEAKDALAVSGHGSIILFSSIYGMVGPDMSLYSGTDMANAAGYGTSKGGLLQLTRYLATVLAPRIRVNAISPGGVWRDQPEVFRARYEARTPLRRMATEEDLKGAVAYLASDLSAYVTGQNLAVDGGWTIW
jgi:NAD(P)-dependent dehydrogenase (short-subunit alcohol dehydrogenase family)